VCVQFIKIQFAKNGRIAGATIEKYLLEKTRLVHQTAGERNYHIFYQMLKGASAEELRALYLEDAVDAYAYLSSSAAAASIPNVSDADEYRTTLECMQSIGMDAALQADVFRLLAAILHLGNVVFDRRVDAEEDQVSTATAATAQALRIASELLGVDSEDMLACMTKQNMYVGGATIVKVQTYSQVRQDRAPSKYLSASSYCHSTPVHRCLQAMEKRNSFAKTVYSMLFSWLVDKINTTIAPPSETALKGKFTALIICPSEFIAKSATAELLPSPHFHYLP
jgi:myosin-5